MSHRNNYNRSNNGTRVYVGGLSNGITKEELETEFERFGKLKSVWVALNPPGFAFVEFAEKEDAEAACSGLNNQEVLGSMLRVELSKARRQGGSRSFGMRGRGFRQGKPGGSRGGFHGQGDGNSRRRAPYQSNRGYGPDSGGFRRNHEDRRFSRNSYGNSSF